MEILVDSASAYAGQAAGCGFFAEGTGGAHGFPYKSYIGSMWAPDGPSHKNPRSPERGFCAEIGFLPISLRC